MAVIEADTDGVYFAVPEGFTEAEERALVAEVAAELPIGAIEPLWIRCAPASILHGAR